MSREDVPKLNVQDRSVPGSEQERSFTDDELAILRALGGEHLSADVLVEKTGIPARRVLSALTMLQVYGAVEEDAGRLFFTRLPLNV